MTAGHHSELWATVSTGLEDDAIEEISERVGVSRAARALRGQCAFSVAAARPAREVAEALRALRTVDYARRRVARPSSARVETHNTQAVLGARRDTTRTGLLQTRQLRVE